MARKPESFFQEMKHYVGFTEKSAQPLPAVGPAMERHFRRVPAHFYERIGRLPEAELGDGMPVIPQL